MLSKYHCPFMKPKKEKENSIDCPFLETENEIQNNTDYAFGKESQDSADYSYQKPGDESEDDTDYLYQKHCPFLKPHKEKENYIDCPYQKPKHSQSHTHEFLGSTMLAEECKKRHNHRFAGVTSEAIPVKGGGPGNHVHEILVKTDFFDHYHKIKVKTGPPVYVGGGKHVHFVQGKTSLDDDHWHKFVLATLIEAPLDWHKDCP